MFHLQLEWLYDTSKTILIRCENKTEVDFNNNIHNIKKSVNQINIYKYFI